MPLASALRNVLSALFPLSEGPLMADPTAPQTIGDLITINTTAVSTQSDAAVAAAAADAALNDANAKLSQADSDLSAALKALGVPVYVEPTPGDVTFYLSDTTPKGFHAIKPLSATTLLPAPAPVSPTPDPAPAN